MGKYTQCNWRKLDGDQADGNTILLYKGVRCALVKGHTNDCIFPDPDDLEAIDDH